VSRYSNSREAIRLPIFVAIALAVGMLIGRNMAGSPKGSGLSSGLSKLRQVMTLVETDYVDEVNTDKLAEKAIEKMLLELDPHSVYIPYEEQKLNGRATMKGLVWSSTSSETRLWW
jgi:carboxyl-terminal processing protease